MAEDVVEGVVKVYPWPLVKKARTLLILMTITYAVCVGCIVEVTGSRVTPAKFGIIKHA